MQEIAFCLAIHFVGAPEVELPFGPSFELNALKQMEYIKAKRVPRRL